MKVEMDTITVLVITFVYLELYNFHFEDCDDI